MTASYVVLSITLKDGMMLRLVPTAEPAFQAGMAQLLIRGWGH